MRLPFSSARVVAMLVASVWLVGSGVHEARAQDSISFSGSGDNVGFGQSAPDYYVVQAGDTLWEISSRFLGNPYYWPRLWSINDYITNPHWIYPGNRIVFRMGTLVEPPRVELETTGTGRNGYSVVGLDYESEDAECGPDVRFTVLRQPRTYEAPGFLAQKGDVEVYGRVRKARGMQTVLADRDLLYLDVDDPDAFTCGDVVSIFRKLKSKVRHPTSSRTKFGSLYTVVGEAKVVHRYKDTIAVVVRHTWAEIERGDLVGPVIPVAVEVEVGEPAGKLDGVVVERLHQENFLLGQGETVFIDRGRADGVRVGNSFYVVEQRDERMDTRREDRSLPPSVIGRLVIVRVDEYNATAIVTDSARSFTPGTRVVQKME